MSPGKPLHLSIRLCGHASTQSRRALPRRIYGPRGAGRSGGGRLLGSAGGVAVAFGCGDDSTGSSARGSSRRTMRVTAVTVRFGRAHPGFLARRRVRARVAVRWGLGNPSHLSAGSVLAEASGRRFVRARRRSCGSSGCRTAEDLRAVGSSPNLVDVHGLVDPAATGVFDVGSQTRPRQRSAANNISLHQRPRPMTDHRHRLSELKEAPNEPNRVGSVRSVSGFATPPGSIKAS